MKIFKFNELKSADLVVDAIYRGGEVKNLQSEVLSKLVGVGNAGGFRYKGSLPNPKLVVLTSNGSEGAWPDFLDPFTGVLDYYGDNRKAGELHSTKKGGNKILKDSFDRLHGDKEERLDSPVFLYFSKWGTGYDWQFKGLIVPGGQSISNDDELIAIWRTAEANRFQNYRAKFTVLDVGIIKRDWLDDILMGRNKLTNAPKEYKDWIVNKKYRPLLAPPVSLIRTKAEQLPSQKNEFKLLSYLHKKFPKEIAYKFEPIALAIWTLICTSKVSADITRRSVDGGRDAIGHLLVGADSDPLQLDFALEAKCYEPNSSVGVKETSRLISRLRRHHFGVLVTTSYVAEQAYKEIRDDGHPIAIISGIDIVNTLIKNDINTEAKLEKWLTLVGHWH